MAKKRLPQWGFSQTLLEACERRAELEMTDLRTVIASYLRRYAAGAGRPRAGKRQIGDKEILLTNNINPTVKQEKNVQENKISSSRILSSMLGLDLAWALILAIRQNNPNAVIREAQREKWAKEADLMMSRDNRTEEQIRALITWSQADPFWKCNILSMGKLREKFDQLLLKSRDNGSKAQESKHAQLRKRNEAAINEAFADEPE